MIPLDAEAAPSAALPISPEPVAEAARSTATPAPPEIARPPKTFSEPITFLVYSPYPRYSGGRETWLYNVSVDLSRRGQATRIVAHASNRRAFHAEVEGVQLIALPSARYFDRAFFWINRALVGLPRTLEGLVLYPATAAFHLSRTKPKLLVCMNSIPEGLAAIIAGQPFFVAVRGDVPAEMAHGFKPYEWLLRRLERFVLRRALRVLANGHDTQERLRAEGIQSVVVPNGVDVARYRAQDASSARAQRLNKAAAGRPVISVVGTLRLIKGTDVAIDCAVELKRAGEDFIMDFVGKGEIEHYRRIAQTKGAADVVLFSGETRDVPAMLRRTDIFLGVSGGSGMSMALLEAMAAGAAVVALDTPVYRQLITDGVNGILARDAAELAQACVQLLRDPDRRRRLGAAASRTADQYDWPVVVDRLYSVLAGD